MTCAPSRRQNSFSDSGRDGVGGRTQHVLIGRELGVAEVLGHGLPGHGQGVTIQEAGVDIMEECGTPLPDSVMESIGRTKCALKAPITTPVGTGFQSVNVRLRKAL